MLQNLGWVVSVAEIDQPISISTWGGSMLLPLVTIATFFMGVWVLAIAIESRFRSMRKRKQKSDVLPKSDVSLISLIFFLFAPTHFISPSDSPKFESEFHRSTDWPICSLNSEVLMVTRYLSWLQNSLNWTVVFCGCPCSMRWSIEKRISTGFAIALLVLGAIGGLASPRVSDTGDSDNSAFTINGNQLWQQIRSRGLSFPVTVDWF